MSPVADDEVKEYGNLRFDVLQSVDDPTNFLLIEVYRREDSTAMASPCQKLRSSLANSARDARTAADAVKHKSTPHYLEWRLAELSAGVAAFVFWRRAGPQCHS